MTDSDGKSKGPILEQSGIGLFIFLSGSKPIKGAMDHDNHLDSVRSGGSGVHSRRDGMYQRGVMDNEHNGFDCCCVGSEESSGD